MGTGDNESGGAGAPHTDERALGALRAAVGPAAFAELFDDCLFEVAERLGRLEDLVAAGDLPAARRLAHDLVSVAGHIGLAAVSAVAADLEACCIEADPVAARAVATRLARIGAESLAILADWREDPAAAAG